MGLWPNGNIEALSLVYYLIFALCFIYLILSCVSVWKRYQGKSFISACLLCCVNIIAVITLLLLILPLYQEKAINLQAIVITNNTDELLLKKAVDRYQASQVEQLFVLVTNKHQREELQRYFKEQNLLDDVVWLTSSYPLLSQNVNKISDQPMPHKYQTLYVYGDGFTQEQLAYFSQTTLSPRYYYFPSQPLLGLVDIQWSQEVILGGSVPIVGTLQSADANKLYHVELVDINDDVLLHARLRAKENFHFSFTPKATGVNSYFLTIRDQQTEEVLVKERVQVNVVSGEKLNVLVNVASPSFEVRHLKNWLAEQGSQLTVISQTSKNANLMEAINIDKKTNSAIGDITADNLASVDLLILDGRSIVLLSTIQQQQLITSIKEGLALFVFIDNALIDKHQPNQLTDFIKTFASLKVKADVNINKPTTVLYQNDKSDDFSEHVLIPSNINLINKRGRNLVINSDQKPLVLNKNLGFGSVSLSAINTSYQWKLKGLSKAYGQYWQYLLGTLIKEQTPLHWLKSVNDPILLPQTQTRLCYFSKDEHTYVQHTALLNKVTKVTQAPSETVMPSPSPTLLVANKLIGREYQYCVDWLVTTHGWHQFKVLTDKHSDKTLKSHDRLVYISDPEQWLALQQLRKQRATLKKSLNTNQNSHHTNSINPHYQIKVAINKWPVWLIFISCCCILWIERKRV